MDEGEKYRKANLLLQIFLALGLALIILGVAGLINQDQGFIAGVIVIVIGAGIRQIFVSRN